ncbi:hypothetical protein J2Z21_000222 [Streptomyces griseochromogenes]|uniref:SH3b domain-containing protein n=1 Tax=Streptomyces griseochromogenes TaxID=68214 RepID=A0A1B1B1J6_9ACTN|nr:SH3 domain-containing protein [Streptomyces griseochromogenes]ANP52695.1 hypothetical protein AVL59_27000 [Streptomyces griseochromogenes]MBP2047300.1 hypothetical protein [Streptomyces griseochromogenes]
MILRTLKSGLLATVAVLAFLPTAAGAAPASAATTSHPAPVAAAQYPVHHPKHRAHHRRHHVRRVRHFVAPGMAHAMSYRRTLPVYGRVSTHGARLNVRSGPGTYYRVIGHRHAYRLLTLTCKTYGSRVYGNHIWYRLPHHRGYVSARYVRTGHAVPWC